MSLVVRVEFKLLLGNNAMMEIKTQAMVAQILVKLRLDTNVQDSPQFAPLFVVMGELYLLKHVMILIKAAIRSVMVQSHFGVASEDPFLSRPLVMVFVAMEELLEQKLVTTDLKMEKDAQQIAEVMKVYGFVKEGMHFLLLFVSYVEMEKEKLMKLATTD